MKNLLLAFALVGTIAACNSEKTSVADDSAASMPKKECCEMKSCDDAAKAGCTDAAKAECHAKKSGCAAPAAKP